MLSAFFFPFSLFSFFKYIYTKKRENVREGYKKYMELFFRSLILFCFLNLALLVGYMDFLHFFCGYCCSIALHTLQHIQIHRRFFFFFFLLGMRVCFPVHAKNLFFIFFSLSSLFFFNFFWRRVYIYMYV